MDPRDLPKDLKALLGIRPRILVVDDDEDSRDLAIFCLGAGFEVVEAADGREGLLRAEELMPNLILLDIRMPGIDGVEVLSRLREKPALKSIPVIVITVVSDKELRWEIMEKEVEGYLVKPFHITDFRSEVTKVLGKRWRLPSKMSGEPDLQPCFGLKCKSGVRILELVERRAQWRVAELGQILSWFCDQGLEGFVLDLVKAGKLDQSNARAVAEMLKRLKGKGARLAVVSPEPKRLRAMVGKEARGEGVIKVMTDLDKAVELIELYETGILE